MSDYCFGVGRGKLPKKRVDQIDKIARKHGACFVYTSVPGNGIQYWFSGPNLGFPFDRALERDVIEAVTAAGLWPPAERDGA